MSGARSVQAESGEWCGGGKKLLRSQNSGGVTRWLMIQVKESQVDGSETIGSLKIM